uniref:Uncharacterized protein n=1 Tax=Anguilla anguilla TaxID=7936 RepID=A0A0E9WUM1_ANGAN
MKNLYGPHLLLIYSLGYYNHSPALCTTHGNTHTHTYKYTHARAHTHTHPRQEDRRQFSSSRQRCNSTLT